MFVKSRVNPVPRNAHFLYVMTICPPTLSALLIALVLGLLELEYRYCQKA